MANEPPSVPVARPTPSRSPVRRRLVVLGIALVATIFGLPAAIWGVQFWSAQRELQAALALLDETEPGWRFRDMVQKQQPIPDSENGALRVREIKQLLPKHWIWSETTDKNLFQDTPQCQLSLSTTQEVHSKLASFEEAFRRARGLSRYPVARFTPDPKDLQVEDAFTVGGVMCALNIDIKLALQMEDSQRAWDAVQSLIVCGNYPDGHLSSWSMLNQLSAMHNTFNAAERWLGQSQLSPDRLKYLQDHFKKAASKRLNLDALRCLRALRQEWFASMENGEVPIKKAFAPYAKSEDAKSWFGFAPSATMLYRSHVIMLDLFGQAMEAESLEGAEKYARLKRLDDEYETALGEGDREKRWARIMLMGVVGFYHRERRVDTLLACAQAGLAAERFRLAEKRWPASLGELVAKKYLENIPIDLYNDQPLHFRRADDGVVIYSVGEHGDYRGNALDPATNPETIWSQRIEFRLWDPKHRRQPSR